MISAAINGAIFAVTAVIVTRFFRKDGKWAPERARTAFRFFTTLSNVLCALAELMVCICQLAGEVPRWVWILKYIGTAAVTVTMVTVFVFLAPQYGLKNLLAGQEFFLHFLTPIMALVSFCVFERRGMDFPTALYGMLPLVLYAPLYLYKVLLAPEGKRWEDFYGFNRTGKWPVSLAAMLAGTFALCMVFLAACR